MHLIAQADIEAVTGVTTDLSELIDYAQAQAEALLGYLEEGTATITKFMYEDTTMIRLDDYPINALSSITYKATANSTEQTLATTKYRYILKEAAIFIDETILEGYTLDVTYTYGWNQTTVTNLVKMLLVMLVVNHYYSLYPDLKVSSQVVLSEKIGDYAIKYANINDSNLKTFEDWINYLVNLIKGRGNFPEVY